MKNIHGLLLAFFCGQFFSMTLPAGAAPPAPTNFTVMSGSGQVFLQWSASAGATSYNIFRAPTNRAYALIGNVAGTSYTDSTVTNGVGYFYVVAALGGGPGGSNSAEVAALPLAPGYHRLVNRLSGLALDNPNGIGSGGVDQQPYGGTNQLWSLVSLGSGVFAVFDVNGTALSGQTNSAQLTMNPYLGVSYQLWTFQVTNDTYYIVRNLNTGQVMDDFGGSTNAGTTVGQWVLTGGDNQQWSVSESRPQLFSVAVTNTGPFAQYTFTGQVDSHSLATTLICMIGTNTSYGISVTNMIAGTNVLVDFNVTVTIPNATNFVSAWHATVVAANFAGSVTNADLLAPSPVLQLTSVTLTNGGTLPQYTFAGLINPGGLDATVICQFGADTSYGSTVTNIIPATNQPVNYNFSVPFTVNTATTLHGKLTVSNLFNTATSGDIVVNSISFEDRLSKRLGNLPFPPTTDSLAWMDLNDDGYLDLATTGSPGGGGARATEALNPGATTNVVTWPAWLFPQMAGGGTAGCIALGDLDNDNLPDGIFAGGGPDSHFCSSCGDGLSVIRYGTTNHNSQVLQFYAPAPIGTYVVIDGARAIIADFDHSGKQSALLCGSGVGNKMLGNFVVDGVRSAFTLLSLATIVDIADFGATANPTPFGGWSLSGGFLGTNGFMDVYGFNMGDASTTPKGTFYRNDGELGFTVAGSFELYAGLPKDQLAGSGNSVWADFNGDGFDDIMIMENDRNMSTNFFLINDGHGNFTNAGWALPQWPNASVAAGDLFHHGRPDIVMTGANGTPGGPYGRNITILRNDGNGIFTPVDYGLFPEVSVAAQGIALADYDNDGRLDIAVTGGFTFYVLDQDSISVYRNELNIASNAPPTAPGALNSIVSTGRVDLSWSAATDDITPANDLTYNLRIGTNSLGTQTVSPLANVTTGWRKISARGNLGPCLGTYYRLPPGTYYWSVQAIDGAFAGGAWATEQTFTITNAEPVKINIGNHLDHNYVNWSWRFQNYTLEIATNLPPANPAWAPSTLDAGTYNGKFEVWITNDPPSQIFRLRQ